MEFVCFAVIDCLFGKREEKQKKGKSYVANVVMYFMIRIGFIRFGKKVFFWENTKSISVSEAVIRFIIKLPVGKI